MGGVFGFDHIVDDIARVRHRRQDSFQVSDFFLARIKLRRNGTDPSVRSMETCIVEHGTFIGQRERYPRTVADAG